MSAPGIPQNFNVQTANGQTLISWSLSAGADSYEVVKSLDNVTYAALVTVSGSPLATSYLETAPTLGVQAWYKVRALTGTDASPYTSSASAVPTPTGEMNLAAIRLAAQQRADRVNSNFVTMPEWNKYINQAMFELYDLLTTVYEDYNIATPIQFTTNGSSFLYPLPNGSNTFTNALTGATITPKAFYKLIGMDLAVSTANNAFVTLHKFNFIDRNRYVYPNSSGTIYGINNMQYRIMGSNVEFIPTPSSAQTVRLWYIPRLTELLQDTDTTDIGISGWIEYVIVRAAKYALDKEESDTSKLDQQIIFLKGRIEESASNRDAGMPDTISNTRGAGGGWGRGGFGDGPNGGF
jgi:hypothetical protein